MSKAYLTFAKSGRRYYYETPSKQPPLIGDLFYGLAGIYRGCGQWRPYSVLHHSWVCREFARYKMWNVEGADVFGLKVLLHDVAEAVMQDIPTPLKGLLPEYVKLYEQHYAYIHQSLGVARPIDYPNGPQEATLLHTIDKLCGDVEGDFFVKDWTTAYPPDTMDMQRDRTLILHSIQRALLHDADTLVKLCVHEYETVTKTHGNQNNGQQSNVSPVT